MIKGLLVPRILKKSGDNNVRKKTRKGTVVDSIYVTLPRAIEVDTTDAGRLKGLQERLPLYSVSKNRRGRITSLGGEYWCR